MVFTAVIISIFPEWSIPAPDGREIMLNMLNEGALCSSAGHYEDTDISLSNSWHVLGPFPVGTRGQPNGSLYSPQLAMALTPMPNRNGMALRPA